MDLEKELSALQYSLGYVDMLTRHSDHGSIEFLVVRRESIAIRMDTSHNHQRAHIHVDYGKQKHVASYAIDNGERLAGNLSKKYDREVRKWVEGNKEKLLKVWALTQSGKPADRIICQMRGSE